MVVVVVVEDGVDDDDGRVGDVYNNKSPGVVVGA